MRVRLKLWQGVLLCIALGTCLALAGCADAPPTPTVASSVAGATSQAVAAPPTLASTQTPSATPTATPPPTSTPTPSPTSTPTPTWTPSPTLTPTLQPGSQLEAALRHKTNGQYVLAILALQDLLDSSPTPEEARQVRYHLAESYLLHREYMAAADAWERFIASYPDDSLLPQVTLMAARAYHAADVCARAIPHYEAYLTYETILGDLVHEWIGDCYAAEGRWAEAIAAYRQALDSTGDRSIQAGLLEKIAGVYLTLQDYGAAVAEYDAILNVAQTDSYRAKIEYLAGQALAAAGDVEAAHARYRRAVDNYPEAEYAYFSLVELVDSSVEVDEFQRGLIDYHAGKTYSDASGAAIRAFDRYLAAGPAQRADEALYYKALSQRATGEAGAAFETLETLIADYPKSAWLARAWLEKGATQASIGDNDRAVAIYQELAAMFPADELAPQALWRAAQLREEEGDHAEAAKLYEDLLATYPAYEDADASLWRAGLSHYRAGDLDRAVATWQDLLARYPKSSYRARSRYWLGKLGATPESTDDGDYWDQLVIAAPRAYFALRVQQIRSGESLTATRLITAAAESPPWNTALAQEEMLAWLGDWTDVPTGTNLIALPDSLKDSLGLRRGEALMNVGLRREALDAFDGVRAAAWDEPQSLASLALFFRDLGFHGLAARSALRLAALWPEGSIHESPLVVRHLAYPLAYADLLSAEAQARDLDPLLLAALIRQESLFEPVAESWVGARGLGQVMPATGEGIARSLGMEGFALDDLYRPSVSVRFGAYYLAVQMNRFDDQILVSLAAYNGGPGNALRWLEAAGDDLDLFVETITASESRRYLQRVYEQYKTYETLYRATGSGEQ